MPIVSTKRVLIWARQFRVKSGSKDLPVGHFRVRPQNSGQSTVLRMRSFARKWMAGFCGLTRLTLPLKAQSPTFRYGTRWRAQRYRKVGVCAAFVVFAVGYSHFWLF